MKNILITLIILAISGCGSPEKVNSEDIVTLTLATTTQDGTHWADTWKVMKDYVEKESKGKLKIDLSFGGALGSDTQLLQKVQVGSQVQLAISSGANLASIVNIIKAFDVPFLMDNSQEPVDLFFPNGKFGGKIAEDIQPFFNEKNLRLYGVVPFELRGILTKNKTVRQPSDLKGLKIRVTPNPVERKIIGALGAGPTTMGISEVYTALQTGTIDGLAIPPITSLAFALGEVGKSLNVLNFQLHGSFIVINNKTWENLPEDLQVILQEGMNKAIAETRATYDEKLVSSYDELKAQGVDVYFPSDAEKDAFKQVILEPATQQALESFTPEEKAFFDTLMQKIS